MGILAKWNNKDEKQVQAEAFMKTLEKNSDKNVKAVYERLNNMKARPGMMVMKPFYLYTACLEMMMSNAYNFQTKDYLKTLDYAEEIYKGIFIYEEATPDFDDLFLIFLELFDENSAAAKRCFNQVFYNLFENKHNYVKWLRGVAKYANVAGNEKYYIPYALKARSFFFDENQFTANVLSACIKIFGATNPQAVYEEELQKIEHMVGIYNVDETRILNLEQHIAATEGILSRASEILNTAEERLKTIDGVTKTAYGSVKSLCEEQLAMARAELAEIAAKMQKSYDDFVNNQKQMILYDKQKLLDSVFAQAEQRLKELQQAAGAAVSAAGSELMRINQESGLVMNKVQAVLQDDEKLRETLATVAANSELIGKMDKVLMISEQNLEQIEKSLSERAARQETQQGATGQVGLAQQGAGGQMQPVTCAQATTVMQNSGTAGGENIPQTAWYQPINAVPVGQYITEPEEAIAPVSDLLDESVAFSKRWAEVKKRKQLMEKAGEHFHEKFDDVLMAVMENANPYLIGPSGCGKTFMVNQIARILEVDYIDIGYINEEYDILGFQTANGGYSRPNFYRCYKYGKIAFCDELDNGNSRATVKLNSFLSNTRSNASYNFPNGENVKRHANFRVIGAGNTAGNGADNNYNTREKIEESVQQRFMPIYIGYDNAVEKMLLRGYDEWFGFIVKFRKATDAWSRSSYGDAPGIITTRDVARIRRYLDNNSFDMNKILDYEFLQTKDADYLAFLSNFLQKEAMSDKSGKTMISAFVRKVTAKRQEQGY